MRFLVPWLLYLSLSIKESIAGPHYRKRSQNEFRLVDGEDSSNGRVEVLHDGVWGTICDDYFGDEDAGIVCRSLGYDDGTVGVFSHGSGKIWMDDIHCDGDEASLAECSFDGWGVHNCDHFEDVGVYCRSYSGAGPSVTETPTGPSVLSCQSGWAQVGDECIKFFHGISNNSPDKANEICADNGGTTVKLDSQEKTSMIMEAFPGEEYLCFPGMRKIGRKWVYQDGSSLTWTNWRKFPPEPQGDGNCISVLFVQNGQWNDVPCTSHCGTVIACSKQLSEVFPVDESTGCQTGWTYSETFGECYKYFHGVKDNSPATANALCRSNNAALVLLDSEAKSNEIKSLFPNEEYFCFPEMMKVGNQWVYPWGAPLAWTNWRTYPPEPQGDGDCISVLWVQGGVWNDVPCNSDCGTVVLCAQDSDYFTYVPAP